MERGKIRLFLSGCVLFLISSAWLSFIELSSREQNDQIEISKDSGIYTEGMKLEVRIYREGVIYYTEDGEKPTEEWDNVKEYTEPFILYAEPEGSAYSFYFFCQFSDGTLTEPVERNYIVLQEGRTLDAEYVISVQGDEEELFGYEEGIFVKGRRWDEYLEVNPDINPQHVLIPANYYEDKEVPVHASVFSKDGEEIVSQMCGIKIYGRANRAKNQKSIRLTARYDYSEENEFEYPFLDKLVSDNTGRPVLEYQRLSLHNSGQDNGYSFIRNTLCGELAREAGFPDVLVSESAVVYINGHYMGIYWLQNTFDDKYFKEKYGFYRGEMAVCEGGLSEFVVEEGQEPFEQKSAEEYNAFCNWLKEADVNDPEVWDMVSATIDVGNLLKYMAIEYYANNFDWPGANVKAYRYVPTEGEQYREGTVFDGRYRYLLFDLDYGMGLFFYGWLGKGADAETLADLCDVSQSASVFAKIMEREECRNIFINEVVNLGNISFSKENVDRVLEELNDTRWNELVYMMEQTDILKGSLWETDDNNIDNVIQELQSIRDFAEVRRSRVLTEMMQRWKCGTLFQVKTDLPEELELLINEQPVWTGSCWYFGGIPVAISTKAASGIKVTGYEINGQYLEGEKIEILADDYLEEDSLLLDIKPFWEYEDREEFSIQSFHIKGDQDWIILENTGSTVLHLVDYFLSDDAEEPLKGRLPDVVLNPGECMTVYGDKYNGEEIPGSFKVDFSWNKEEPVILAHLTDGIVERRN